MKATITKYEHVRITAPMSERDKVLKYLEHGDWRATRIGPYPIGPGKMDTSRLLVLADRKDSREEAHKNALKSYDRAAKELNMETTKQYARRKSEVK